MSEKTIILMILISIVGTILLEIFARPEHTHPEPENNYRMFGEAQSLTT